LSKQKGHDLKKKIRIISALLGGALAISGAIVAYAGTTPGKEDIDTQALHIDVTAFDGLTYTNDKNNQSQKEQTSKQSVPTPFPSWGPESLMLADVAPTVVEDTSTYSEEETNDETEENDFRYAKWGNQINDEEDMYEYSEGEKIYMARCVYAEARGESFEGQVAVATVIINRFESGKFGSSVKKVVFARNQFAVSKRYNDKILAAVEEAIERRGDYPDNMFYFQASKRKTWRNFVYYKRIGGHSFYCSAK
jgi:hypothetical protein